MVRHNPFAALKGRLKHRALIPRNAPWRTEDRKEIEKAARRIADGSEQLIWAGWRETAGHTVIGFDTPEKAAKMREWIEASGIADRPAPTPPPAMEQLQFGKM
jgi:hypothetical protein